VLYAHIGEGAETLFVSGETSITHLALNPAVILLCFLLGYFYYTMGTLLQAPAVFVLVAGFGSLTVADVYMVFLLVSLILGRVLPGIV
jgi:hypothetical protein